MVARRSEPGHGPREDAMQPAKTAMPMVTPRRELETMFERLFRSPLFPEGFPGKGMEAGWEPALDLSETERAFVARFEVPGFHKENLDVKFENDLLTVSGQRASRSETKEEEFLWTEREEGRFVRAVRIPAAIDPAKVEALYEDGLLTVTLPKLAPSPKAKIAIK